MTTALACPVCGEGLTLLPAAATCPKGHAFDRARSGYLNLLLSNKKQSAEPGDSLAMLQSRRAFLEGGYYDQMAAAAAAALAEVVAGQPAPEIADLGCGEGFFTARAHASLAPLDSARGSSAPLDCARGTLVPTFYGVDISRPGIKMAAAHKQIQWIVASLHHSPFRPRSLAAALSVFAPIDAADVRRVIRDDGALITVTPGPDHLDALRIIIYSSVKPHPQTPALMAGDTLFEHTASTRVRYPIALESQAQIMNLLAMTPYYWHISRATRAAVEALSRLHLAVDAYLNVFRPKPASQGV